MMKLMTARFSSKCSGCRQIIRRGSTIFYDTCNRKAYHEHCAPAQIDKDYTPDPTDIAYEDQCARACGL